ncbi:MAG TPA: hypothetical protein VGM03_02215 [Phycisphaerae bacterium]|jgi:hypothetical protein
MLIRRCISVALLMPFALTMSLWLAGRFVHTKAVSDLTTPESYAYHDWMITSISSRELSRGRLDGWAHAFHVPRDRLLGMMVTHGGLRAAWFTAVPRATRVTQVDHGFAGFGFVRNEQDPEILTRAWAAGPLPTTTTNPVSNKILVRAIRAPLWPALLLFSVYPLARVLRGPLRRRGRWQRGCCPGCGYDLTGNESGRCSECGRVKPNRPAPRPLLRPAARVAALGGSTLLTGITALLCVSSFWAPLRVTYLIRQHWEERMKVEWSWRLPVWPAAAQNAHYWNALHQRLWTAVECSRGQIALLRTQFNDPNVADSCRQHAGCIIERKTYPGPTSLFSQPITYYRWSAPLWPALLVFAPYPVALAVRQGRARSVSGPQPEKGCAPVA